MGTARPVERVDVAAPDAVLLDLHGAMVTEQHDDGEGELQTNFGTIDFHPGDYLIIPRGTTAPADGVIIEGKLILPSFSGHLVCE